MLTEAGRALIGPARTAVRGVETARAGVASVRELRTGRVDIASMPSQAAAAFLTAAGRDATAGPGTDEPRSAGGRAGPGRVGPRCPGRRSRGGRGSWLPGAR